MFSTPQTDVLQFSGVACALPCPAGRLASHCFLAGRHMPSSGAPCPHAPAQCKQARHFMSPWDPMQRQAMQVEPCQAPRRPVLQRLLGALHGPARLTHLVQASLCHGAGLHCTVKASLELRGIRGYLCITEPCSAKPASTHKHEALIPCTTIMHAHVRSTHVSCNC